MSCESVLDALHQDADRHGADDGARRVIDWHFGPNRASKRTILLSHDGFSAQLETLIRRHLEVFVSDTDLCRLFISEVRTASDYEGSSIQELNRLYTSVLIRIVKDAVKTGEVRSEVNPKLLRDVIFGAIEHLAWRHVNGKGQLRVAQTARDLTIMLTSGICGAR